jgi:nitrogenase subunit NifH
MNIEVLFVHLGFAADQIRRGVELLEREENPQLAGCIARLREARNTVAGVLCAIEAVERAPR